MELATGRSAVDGGEECLVEWAKCMMGNGRNGLGRAVILIALFGSGLAEGAEEMCELLLFEVRCTTEAPHARPNMKETRKTTIQRYRLRSNRPIMDSDFSFDYLLHNQHEESTMEEIIEESQRQQYVNYGDESMAVQLQSPRRNPNFSLRNEQLESLCNFEFRPSSTPNQNPSYRLDSYSGPMVSGIKQLEYLSKSLPQQLQPEFHSLNFYCEVCQVPCSGSLDYNNHLDGKMHEVKLQEVGFARKGKMHQVKLQEVGFAGKDDGNDCKKANPKFWCETCKIRCIDDNSLKQHMAGKKHKKMKEKLESIEGDIGEELRCDLCGIECTSKELLQLHFNGKKHQAEARKLEHAESGGDLRPKRYKLDNTWCIEEKFAGSSQGENKHFLNEVEVKKKQWQDLIRDIEVE